MNSNRNIYTVLDRWYRLKIGTNTEKTKNHNNMNVIYIYTPK